MIIKARMLAGTEFFCTVGGKRFFKQYGLDFRDFIKNGIDSDLLLKSTNNDAQAIKVVKWCKGELYSKKLKKFYREN